MCLAALVMIGGQWINKSDMTTMEHVLVQRQQRLLPVATAFEDALVSGDPAAAIDRLKLETAFERN